VPSTGKSLGDIWRNNPMLKIGAVVFGIVALVGLFIAFGGNDESIRSRVADAPNANEAPGGEVSENYRSAVEQVNQQRLEQAVKTGQSNIPIPVNTPELDAVKPLNEEPPVSADDPLAQWRGGAQNANGAGSITPDPNINQLRDQGQPTPPRPTGPDPQTIQLLSQAMAEQMSGILGKHEVKGSQILQITKGYKFGSQNLAGGSTGGTGTGTGTGGGSNSDVEIQEIIIPAGTIAYAQTMTEANTDAPGPVLARIASGPLMGSRILGSFRNTEDYLTISFNTVVLNGISIPINAVALDPKTTLPGMATDINRRYFKKIVLPAAAAFVEGMGRAIAQSDSTSVSINGETVTTSTSDLDTEQEFYAGVEEGASKLSDEIDNEADRTRTMIRVAAGTPMGILFVEPVIKPNTSQQYNPQSIIKQSVSNATR